MADGRDSGLHRARCWMSGHLREARYRTAKQGARVESDGSQRVSGVVMGCRVVAEIERGCEREKLAVGSDPVGQSHQSGYQMVKRRLVGERLRLRTECVVKPAVKGLIHDTRRFAPVIMRFHAPRCTRRITRLRDWLSMVREDRI